jgi:glycosyltransferase involved in cell wall biosynthesis
MTKPVASIIMPVYNAERFVVSALASVLTERSIPLEVIVIDDGSTDRSVEQVKHMGDDRIQLLHSQHQGVAIALNMALSKVQGEIVMRCDADDLYPPNRIAQQVDWLLSHPEFDAVCGNFSTIDSYGHNVLTMSCGDEPAEITEELHEGITRSHLCTYAIRTEILQAIGGCRSYFRSGEDIDLQLRIAEACRVWYQPLVRYHYRLHETSLTHTMNSGEREFFDSIARKFRHQRRDHGIDALQQGCPPTPPRSQLVLNANEHIQGLLIGRSWQEHSRGKKFKAITTGFYAVWLHPKNLAAWRNVLALILK